MGSLVKAGSILADDPITAYLTNFEKEDVDALLSNLRSCKVDVDPIHHRLRCIKDSLRAAKKWEVDVTSEFGDLIKHVNHMTEPPPDPEHLAKLVDDRLQELLKGAPAAITQQQDGAAGTSSPADRHQELQWREFPEDYKWEADRRWAGKDRPVKTRGKLFKHLEPQLLDCLACLAVLPANAVVKKTLLIYWWIGEGIVTEMGSQTAEGVGEHCFQLLLATGFVVPIKEKLHGADTVKRCRLLPWVRDHLISKAQGNPGGRLLLRTSKTRDAALCDRVSAAAVDPGRLSSVFNLNAQNLGVKREEVSRMRGVTALALGRWQDWPDHHIEVQDTGFLHGLGALSSLKYLSLRGISLIRELPESIGHLANLLILDLHACHSLERLPDGIGTLTKLTHLDVSDCCLLEVMPRGLMYLHKLVVVKGYAIRTDAAHRGSILGLVEMLSGIRKLSMCLGRDTRDAQDLGSLPYLKHLRSLTITWGRERSTALEKKKTMLPAPAPAKQKTMKKMFSKLSSIPPTQVTQPMLETLEKLDLGCVSSTITLDWLRPGLFPNLKKLYIRGGKLGSLPFGDGGWKVETLRLKFLKELDCDYETQIRPCFPDLKWLEIVECPKITSTPKLDKDGIWRRGNKDDGVGAPSTSPAGPSSTSALGAAATQQPTSPPTSAGAQSPSPTTVPNSKGKEIVKE